MKKDKTQIIHDLKSTIKEVQKKFKHCEETLHQHISILKKHDSTLISLKQKDTLLEQLQNKAKIGIWELNLVDNILTWSKEIFHIFNIDTKIQPSYELFINSIHPDDREMVNIAYKKSLQNKQAYSIEHRIVMPNGDIKYVREECDTIFDEKGQALISSGTVQDITTKKEAEIAQEEQLNYLQSIINGVSDPIMVIGKDYTVKMMNNVVRNNIQNLKLKDKKHPKCYEISHNSSTPCHGENHQCPLKQVIKTKERVVVMHNHYNANSSDSFVELSATPLFDKEQNCIGIIEASRDVTTYLKIQNQLMNEKNILNHQAHYDVLTKLPNRLLLNNKLQNAIKKANRNGTKIALLFIDLDHFKEINDSLGHEAGDEVLKIVASRLHKTIRAEDTIARLGGDEFVVVIEHLTHPTDASILAQKIVKALLKPIEIKENTLNISGSIGISIYPDNGTSIQSLLRCSDIAMYKAKNEGRNNFQYFK